MAEPNIDATPIGQVSQKIRMMETKIRQNGVASLRSVPFRKTTRLVTVEGGIFPMSLESSRWPSISVLSEAPSDLLQLPSKPTGVKIPPPTLPKPPKTRAAPMAEEESLSDSSGHTENQNGNIDNDTDKIIDDLNSLQAFTISKLQTFGAPAVFVIMADDENKQLPFTQNHKIGPEIPTAAPKADVAAATVVISPTTIAQPDEEKLDVKQITFEPKIRIIRDTPGADGDHAADDSLGQDVFTDDELGEYDDDLDDFILSVCHLNSPPYP